MFLPVLALFGFYKAWFKPIEAKNLTYGKTVQLKLETSLFSSNIHKNYVIPLSTLENLIFSLFGPYLALKRPNSSQSN